MSSIKDVMKVCTSFGTNFYTVSAVAQTLNLERSITRHKLGKLERAGLISRVKESETPLPNFSKGRPVKEIYYRSLTGLKGKLKECVQQRGCAWDRMWQAARMLRQFTRNDLMVVCSANINNVRCFTKVYTRAGYLRTAEGKGREKTWTLIKDPGPRRPHYQRR